jgi:sec-independent protein translocase protein TatA
MMGLDNPVHLAFLFMLLLLVFGAKRLPELGRSLGAGLRGFKESINGETPLAHLDAATVPNPAAVTQAEAQPVSAGPEATQPRTI